MSFLKIGNVFINRDFVISIEPYYNDIAQYNVLVTYKVLDEVKSARSNIAFNHPRDVVEWIEKELLTNTCDSS